MNISKTTTVEFDFASSGVQKSSVTFSQYDHISKGLIINCQYKRNSIDIPATAVVTLIGKKQDNTIFMYHPVSVEDGTLIFDVTEQMTPVPGTVACEVRIADDGDLIGSVNFRYSVEAAPVSADDVVSESELKGLKASDISYGGSTVQSAINDTKGTLTEIDERLSNLEYMILQNDLSVPLIVDGSTTPTLLIDDLGNAIVADWKY